MSLTKTNVFMDISSATFVYDVAGTPTTKTIPEVTGAKPDLGGSRKTYSGGAARGPRVSKIVDLTRTITLHGADLATALALGALQGTFGTLTLIINDLYNAASTGAITAVLSNAQVEKVGVDQQHNDIGKFDITFSAVWLDGSTDPLAVTQAA